MNTNEHTPAPINNEWEFASPAHDTSKDSEKRIAEKEHQRKLIKAKIAEFGTDALQPESMMARILAGGTAERTSWGVALAKIEAEIASESQKLANG